jgi:hypothetical protein
LTEPLTYRQEERTTKEWAWSRANQDVVVGTWAVNLEAAEVALVAHEMNVVRHECLQHPKKIMIAYGIGTDFETCFSCDGKHHSYFERWQTLFSETMHDG